MHTPSSFELKTSCSLVMSASNTLNTIKTTVELSGTIFIDKISLFAIVINVSVITNYNYYQAYTGAIGTTAPLSY